jgi:hypothetical protein
MANRILFTPEWYSIRCNAGAVVVPTLDDADYIVADIISDPRKTKVVFDAAGDGFTVHFDTFSTIARIIIERTNILEENIIILCGSQCTEETFNSYKNYKKERGWIPKLCVTNTWELKSSDQIRSQPNKYNDFNTTPRIKPKLLLCYNRGYRLHRWYVIYELIKNSLLSRSFVSVYHTLDDLHIPHDQEVEYKQYTGVTDEVIKTLYENKELFPINLSLTDFNDVGLHHYTPIKDLEYFNNSYFSLITETVYYDRPLNGCGHIPTQFLTEKTFKVIAAKHPFILVQRPRILKSLRNIGYRTFHPYINEEYDTIDNNADRLKAIMEEVKRLSSFTDEQWLEFQTNVEPIVKHNFFVLRQASARNNIDSR